MAFYAYMHHIYASTNSAPSHMTEHQWHRAIIVHQGFAQFIYLLMLIKLETVQKAG